VIPGFCRLALEAASSLAAHATLLREGKTYAEVRAILARPTTVNMWLALAMWHDPDAVAM